MLLGNNFQKEKIIKVYLILLFILIGSMLITIWMCPIPKKINEYKIVQKISVMYAKEEIFLLTFFVIMVYSFMYYMHYHYIYIYHIYED